ncbi:hypothetical protein BDBG_06805 [Blastomyces gilchristii SLH14081]|uniref:G domain-containing protein n=1 Tax=Blastomyces gilchristii (strain SLH14081) TaxID=559298 RepID=A0A179UXZ5_BLAGS|nr:uncharacterized protein BDBG_06805 [Blastomyces gilchristii SLH14081]OAT11282.1 hypothetical protein BDBG_06805 [Blastomyces gilchristii SLH14081]
MSMLNSDEPPPPPYSFVGSSQLSPAPSVPHSPPPYHHLLSSGQGGLSQAQQPQSFSNSAQLGTVDNSRPSRRPERIPSHSQNAGQNENAYWAPRQRQEEVRLRQGDLVILMMGHTGSLKSSFISLFADGQSAPIGHSLTGYNIEIYPYQIDQKTRVILVDTPGFNKANRSDTTTLSSIANFLCAWTAPALRNLRMMKKLCGAGNLSHAIMTTNMWGKLHTFDEGVALEKQLRDRYWSSILSHGGMMMRHDGSKRSAQEIIKACLLRSQKPIQPLDIQREMVIQGQRLGDTMVGRELYAEIREERQRYAGELAALCEELDEALRRKDFDHGRVLGETKEQLHRKLRLVEKSGKMLRRNFQRLADEVRAREDGQKRGKKKSFGRTALGIGVGTIVGLTTGFFIC